MCNLGNYLAECGEAFGFRDPFMKRFGLGKISDNAGKIEFPIHLGYGERYVGRKLFPVFLRTKKFCFMANTFRHLCLYVVFNRMTVISAATGRHYYIEIMADDRIYRRFLKPGQKPEAVFEIDADQVTAREFCNLHGLWKA